MKEYSLKAFMISFAAATFFSMATISEIPNHAITVNFQEYAEYPEIAGIPVKEMSF